MKCALFMFVLPIVWCVTASANDRDAQAIVDRYVETSRHWKPNEYRIVQQGRDRDKDVYSVVYTLEALGVGGGGKSFAVLYDPKTHKVTKELAFQ
jgi:hypothetical protein